MHATHFDCLMSTGSRLKVDALINVDEHTSIFIKSYLLEVLRKEADEPLPSDAEIVEFGY